MTYIKYTDEQKQQAREIDVIGFLETFEGFTFQKKGSGYKCVEHDSLYIRGDRMGWYWNSQQVGGSNAVVLERLEVEHPFRIISIEHINNPIIFLIKIISVYLL
jgi:hypothetical protein